MLITNPYLKTSDRHRHNARNDATNDATNDETNDATNAANAATMGPQSQQRLSERERDRIRMKDKTTKAIKQKMINGLDAFERLRDCRVCKARANKQIPIKRAHHVLCVRNSKTRGLTGGAAVALLAAEELRKKMDAPVQPHEKMDKLHKGVDGPIFFRERSNNKPVSKQNLFSSHQSTPKNEMEKGTVSMEEIVVGCEKILLDMASSKEANTAPLGVQAFATLVYESCLKQQSPMQFDCFFNGMTATIPPCHNSVNANYHAVVGQKVLNVDWKFYYPALHLTCPSCGGELKKDRTNYSHNKTLFPIFGLEGPPSWAMVMFYHCQGSCKRRIAANSGDLLCCLPEHIANEYPVDPRYARGNQHIAKQATDVFEEIVLTYTNGELCSRLLYNSINKAYTDKVTSYFSLCRSLNKKPETYPKKNGGYIVKWPPLGGSIRKLYQEAAMSPWIPWKVSDKERHTREMQAVQSKVSMAQDHTFDVVKNYVRRLGAFALWDVASETGEIATAVLVSSTKTREYAHAAQQLLKRTAFAPAAMYSDTWPAKDDFWVRLLGKDIGRLGLFHFLRRIIKTLRQSHMDFHKALADLLMAVYKFFEPDYEKLLKALKNGTLNGTMHSEMDIEEMQRTKQFRER
jgi:hypothetical protein